MNTMTMKCRRTHLQYNINFISIKSQFIGNVSLCCVMKRYTLKLWYGALFHLSIKQFVFISVKKMKRKSLIFIQEVLLIRFLICIK